jgi:hypothetical protein
MTSMVKYVAFNISKFGPKLSKNKIVRLTSIRVIENELMTKVNRVKSKITNRENRLNIKPSVVINIFTEHDMGLGQIGSLTRGIAKNHRGWT